MNLRLVSPVAVTTAIALCSSIAWGENASRNEFAAYSVHGLVSDGSVPADHVDVSLRNAWGIAFNPTAEVWIANNKTSTSTLYDGTGAKFPLGPFPLVTLPPGTRGDASPTGIVFNATTDFSVAESGLTGTAAFIFAGENGTIMGWAPAVDLGNAFVTYDDKSGGAIYKGLALAQNGTANFLYATDFHNAKIDVFDKTFKRVTVKGGFRDPNTPAGYAPFGIQNIQGNLYVTFAKQDGDRGDDVPGRGFGFVDVFDGNGNLIRRVATRGTLNAPWGMAMAPADFGKFANRLLVGNFGDGTINAFDPATGAFVGQLHAANGQILRIDSLWGLSFGDGVLNQPINGLFFTSGPGNEQHGLYGRIDAVAGDGRPEDSNY